METNRRIEQAILKTAENKQIISINNIIVNSLFFPGGALAGEEHEIKKYLENNYFTFFKGRYILFIESQKKAILNYSKPIKIEESQEYTYKLLKTKIKAIKGFDGFKKFARENANINATFFYKISHAIENYNKKY